MRNTYHILVAELVLITFVSTTFLPSQILFAEDISGIRADTTQIVTDTISITSSTDLVATGSSMVSPVDSGTLDTSDLTDSGSTESGGISSGSIIPAVTLSTSIADIGTVISTIDTLIDTGVTDHETGLDLTDPSLKMTSHPIDKNPDIQILVQFKTDIDSYVGQYQVNQIESVHDLKTTETLSEQNIAVMEIDTPLIAIDATFTSMVDFASDTGALDPITEQQITDKITELKADPRVEHVQRNFVYQTRAATGSGFAKLWALDNQGQAVDGITGTPDADIDYPEAIAYASGRLSSTGGVIVAVLDTGIAYNHPDLARHMWKGTNCVSDTGATLGGCIYGYDFANNDLDPADDSGHGSHIAGTIGALSSTDGVTGIAPNVQIMAVKVFGNAGGTTASIIRGINFATKNGAKVINASFGSIQITQSKSDFDYITYQAIQNFPGLFVAAAGNNGLNTDNDIKSFPAGYSSDTIVSGEVIMDREQVILSGEEIIPALQNVISVGATDQDDNIASFSNYGTSSVQIAAPGVNIYSTIPTGSAIGVPQPISYANGWKKKVGANPSTWTTRPNTVVSGENIDISSVLWTDIRTPYVSGESSYIEKTIDNSNKDVAKVLITTWCDTPSMGDQIDILVANNGGLYSRVDYTNEIYNYYEPTGRWLSIDGHTGAIAQYRVIANTDLYNATGSFDLRLKWVTASSGLLDGTGANALSSYGCFVKDIQIDRTISGGHAPYSGTSMAAPHVAGAAALAWSYRPGASMEEVRNAIIWGGDYKSQLADKVQTGRRLNITGMLKALEHPTINVEKLTLSGESGVKIKVKTTPEHMDASQYITISEDPQFSEQGGTTGYYLQQDGVGSNIFEFDSLNPDTTYYYKIIAYGILHNSIEQAVPYSFHTPKLVTQTGTGNISSSGSVYLSGSTADGVIYSTGAQTIILTESGSGRVIATIPLREMTISSSGSWNGIIQAPVQISSATGITVATVNIGVQSIYMIGSPDVSLSLSGSIATISMQVTGTNGTILPVYRSPNILSPFIQIGSCTVTAGLCTFITDHFSLFAVGLPVALTVTPAPISGGPMSGPGGGGGTGGGTPYHSTSQNIKAVQVVAITQDPTTIHPIIRKGKTTLTGKNTTSPTQFKEKIRLMVGDMKQSSKDRSRVLAKKRSIISLIQSQKKTTKKSGASYRSYIRLEKEAIEAFNAITYKRN